MEQLTPYELNILKTVAAINRDTGAPARTRAIACRHEAVAERTMRWYLKRMEAAGVVKRLTPKTGYLACTVV